MPSGEVCRPLTRLEARRRHYPSAKSIESTEFQEARHPAIHLGWARLAIGTVNSGKVSSGVTVT
jgi:hypothetical protein